MRKKRTFFLKIIFINITIRFDYKKNKKKLNLIKKNSIYSFKIIVKSIFDKNNNFLKISLNINLFWNLIKINENNFLKFKLILSKKFKNFNKITNTIIKIRSSTLITKFNKRSKYRKKKLRKKFKNFKNLSFIDFEIFENN